MANFSVKATVHFEADDVETEKKISDKADHLGRYWHCTVVTAIGGAGHNPSVAFEHSDEQIAGAYLRSGCAAKDLERYIKRFKKARLLN